ncbi:MULTISPECIES: IMPACT family protein [Dyella]|uniref:YigZ family protein n=2 Tax=Dyella TaxID=231454 RepID=A0A4R0YW68_9GAMM|nr:MULTISPECIES: YigZ family protein [Dyella]TBR39647.1 YigZ family protein [Dyella terrae]TCI12771.1 YigZ family protein [Dyella soli]
MSTSPLFMLAAPCQHSEDIKKSRFLAQAAPVQSPDEALAFVRKVSDPAATHNCWAYRIGQDYRFNDDGEPGGTAGRPILQAIEGQGIDLAVVVVTRWYGGIKLGAGGLVRAYGGTAAECLRVAARVPIIVSVRMQITCEFAEQALLKARLRELGADVESESFEADGVTLVFRMPQDVATAASARVVDITRGRVEPRWVD